YVVARTVPRVPGRGQGRHDGRVRRLPHRDHGVAAGGGAGDGSFPRRPARRAEAHGMQATLAATDPWPSWPEDRPPVSGTTGSADSQIPAEQACNRSTPAVVG